jgi:hypothetical protein
MRNEQPNPCGLHKVGLKYGRLTQLVSKPITVSYVQLEAPLHLMQKGARDARGLRLSATGAFKPLDDLVLPKDACSSFGNVLFDIGEMPLYGGRVHDNTYNPPRLMTRALLDRRLVHVCCRSFLL